MKEQFKQKVGCLRAAITIAMFMGNNNKEKNFPSEATNEVTNSFFFRTDK